MASRLVIDTTPAGTALPVGVALISLGTLVYAYLSAVGPLVVLVAAALGLIAVGTLARRPSRTMPERDPVTGLPGRAQLVRELERRLARPDAEPTLFLRFDLHGFKAYNDEFGEEAGDALLARLASKLVAAVPPTARVFRLPGDEFAVVSTVQEDGAEQLIDDTRVALSEEGQGFQVGCSFGGALVPYETSETVEALGLTEERLSAHRRSRQGIHTVRALMDALSARNEAEPLSGRLESLAVAVGGLVGVHGDRLEALARAAELHDLGKLSIPSAILDKPGPLDESEWEFVRRQTVVGERILRSSPHGGEVARIVRATHENWDGTGYPDGLAGEEIPPAARIIRVCHAFDAMLSPRSYRPALAPHEALAEIEARAGTAFDPAVVRVLAALVSARSEGIRAA